MSQLERLIMMAEDELTEYSSDARKIEKLRRKIGLSVPPNEQKQVKAELLEIMPKGFFGKLVEEQRQTVALPFWGIAGLGLLFNEKLAVLKLALVLAHVFHYFYLSLSFWLFFNTELGYLLFQFF